MALLSPPKRSRFVTSDCTDDVCSRTPSAMMNSAFAVNLRATNNVDK